MSERKGAVLNVRKGLLRVSLTALTVIGGFTGNGWLAGAAAISDALANSAILKTLLEEHKEEQIELPVPPWWTEDVASWQAVCSGIEKQLPEIMDGLSEQLRVAQTIPTASIVKRAFVEEVIHHLPIWEVKPQDRSLVAGYVTPPLLEKSAEVLKEITDPIRGDALAEVLERVVSVLDEAQKSKATVDTISPSTTTISTNSTSNDQYIHNDLYTATLLEQKQQQEAYDIYICYAEADETEVMKVGEQLKQRGILPWFDCINLKPGTLKRLQQEQQIAKVQAAAIFVGQYAVEDWQALQMYSFLEQYVERSCIVIPVLLKDAPQKPKLPIYLANFQWVDFRKQVPEPIGQLIWGITRQRS